MAGDGCKYTFTVFTPTFNRGHTLGRVYESLKAQTFRDFEWLIVDDGSTDGTAGLVDSWIADAGFAIRYVRQPNLGKGAACNAAVSIARGELFLTLDSDDECVPEALGRLKFHWDSIPGGDRAGFSAVTALCRTEAGATVGTRLPRDVVDSDSLEIYYRYKVRGEKWGFHRTDILRRHPFPVLDRSKYVPEGVVWNRIAREYKTRFIDEVLRIYHVESDESIMRDRSDPGRFAAGLALFHLGRLNDHLRWFSHEPAEFLKAAAHYARFSFHDGTGVARQAGAIENGPARLLWFAMLPVGLAAYLRDRAKTSRGGATAGRPKGKSGLRPDIPGGSPASAPSPSLASGAHTA